MKPHTLPLALSLMFGASAAAQDTSTEGHRPPPPPPPPPVFAVIDADRDGVLSPEEIENASETIMKLDQNGDGEITLDEIRPPRPGNEEEESEEDVPEDGEAQGPPPGKFPPPPVIAALDSDKDGIISAEELEAAPESLKELDTNGDGELTMNELRPQGPPPKAGGGHGRRPQGPPPEENQDEGQGF